MVFGSRPLKERKICDSMENMERWLSGRKRHRAKVLSGKLDRGFESHPLRQVVYRTGVARQRFVSRWDSKGCECAEQPRDASRTRSGNPTPSEGLFRN